MPVPAPETKSPRKRSAGRDLPAAIVVGVSLFGAVIWTLAYFHWGFVLIVAIMLSMGTVEVFRALQRVGMNAEIIPIVAGTFAMVVGTYAAAREFAWVGLPWHSVLLAFLGATVLAALMMRFPRGHENFVRDASASVFIIGYIALLGSFTSLILAADNGAARMVTFLACVIANDTGGYAAGVLLGKHPLAPRISPKKTWEGFAGSLLASMLVGSLLTVFVLGSSWWVGVILGVAMVVFGTAGDLIESAIKRDVGIKDMSSVLPGHGGVMDRLDSLLVAAMPAWLVMDLLVKARA